MSELLKVGDRVYDRTEKIGGTIIEIIQTDFEPIVVIVDDHGEQHSSDYSYFDKVPLPPRSREVSA